MIPQDEIAAIAAALTALGARSYHTDALAEAAPRGGFRWKLAARHPELEMEEIRALR